MMRKIPLVKWVESMTYPGPHEATTTKLADITACFLHFKFPPNFGEFCQRELERKDRLCMRHYELYAQKLCNNPDISFFYEASVKYRDSSQLAELELMVISKRYLNQMLPLVRRALGRAKGNDQYYKMKNILKNRPPASLQQAFRMWPHIIKHEI